MNRLLMFIGVPWVAWLAALMSLVIANAQGFDCEEEFDAVSRRGSAPCGGAAVMRSEARKQAAVTASASRERIAETALVSRPRIAVTAAVAAFAAGAGYAAVSAYWGLGGTALLDTLGGALERQARSGSAASLLLVWGAAALKLAVALLPLAAIGFARQPSTRRWTRLLSWSAGAALIAYGFVLTAVGLLIEAGVVSTSRHSDHRALAWHAFLWDPWFLVWGVLVTVAMVASRDAHPRFLN